MVELKREDPPAESVGILQEGSKRVILSKRYKMIMVISPTNMKINKNNTTIL